MLFVYLYIFVYDILINRESRSNLYGKVTATLDGNKKENEGKNKSQTSKIKFEVKMNVKSQNKGIKEYILHTGRFS